ncbi:MAG: hypothetical protein GQ565_04690 [Candidatus Aegiribacteria sp.]|nr:hypothetical protein [Candidatus Aegiribacteria sp.]
MIRIITITIILLFILTSGCSLFIPMQKPVEPGNRLLLWLPGASSVQVLSDWNDWGGGVAAGGIVNPVSGRMEKDDNGLWTLDIAGLPGGVYRYAFYVNGYKWIRDPVNPETAVFEGRTVSIIMVAK